MNAEWWNALPAEFREVISKAATAMGEYNDQLVDQNSEAARQAIIKSGAEVYMPTAEELKAFQDAARPVYQQAVTEGICTQAELDEMLSIVASAKK